MPIYQPYEQQLAELVRELERKFGRESNHYLEALTHKQRLTENIALARLHGTNNSSEHSRSEIIVQANRLALAQIGMNLEELVQNAQLSSGLENMKEFARDTQMRLIISQHQQVFHGLRNEILQFTFYKEVHDQLHSLQRCYKRTTKAVRRKTPDGSDDIQLDDDVWEQIEFLEGEVNTVCQKLHASLSPPIEWVNELQQAQENLACAHDNKKINKYNQAVDAIDYILSTCSSDYNNYLCTTARGLVSKFSDLVTTIKDISKKLQVIRPHDPNIAQFGENVYLLETESNTLMQQLKKLLSEHDTWQEIDRDMRVIEIQLPDKTNLLKFFWNKKVPKVQSWYYDCPERWAIKLKEAETNLETALRETRADDIQTHFESYYRGVRDRFFAVDQKIFRQCKILSTFAEQLKNLDMILG